MAELLHYTDTTFEPHSRSDLARFAGAAAIYALGLAMLVRADVLSLAGGEASSIETLSAAAYLVCLIVYATLVGLRSALRHWYVPSILTIMFLRELDLDNHDGWTYGLSQSMQYFGPGVPPFERLASLAILGIVVGTTAVMIGRHARAFLAGLRDRQAPALCIALAALVAMVSQYADGIERRLAPWGITVSERAADAFMVIEECLELSIPVLLATAIVIDLSRRRSVFASRPPAPLRP
ncbi:MULTISPECIES: hypothetical protein [unclassified Roseitalea]|uniref:hypothetical protein n=1 Tax=unclassified Roseitalea TaxID=2639107 RepID=UPI00273D5C94|nr:MULTISPECIES: hypothetical protein [unclassified Roseitalea]